MKQGAAAEMCDWRRWIWPGIFATLVLGALAVFLRSGPVESELTGLAGSALATAHPWAQIELDGRDATLRGAAPSEEARLDAQRLANAAYDVRVVNNEAGLIALAEPYVFAAAKTADGVTLTGHVPDEVTRVEILATAPSRNARLLP
ncbi:MAG: BON domain-containing protein [Phyllobacteriaceae bacterium]|nr:BON domain-containing protein [Phyllobacteriaceae bacterium]